MNITASLQEKRNIYQVVLSYRDNNGKRKQKWISTGISVKGNNKRLANEKLEEIKQNYTKYIPSPLTSQELEDNYKSLSSDILSSSLKVV